jgi:AcrR family transcriptional regulator
MVSDVDQLSGAQTRTRAAILAATAAVLAADRTATLPDIAAAARVCRTTVHRYFSDRERLLHEVTLDAIRALDQAVLEADTEHGPAREAMRRLITAFTAVGDRIAFLYGDPAVLRVIAPEDRPNDDLIMRLIERGQREQAFDSELSARWIEHALFALLLQASQDVNDGLLPRHAAAPTVIRTFEQGMRSHP